MPATREPKKRTASWGDLRASWLTALRDAITRRDPDAFEPPVVKTARAKLRPGQAELSKREARKRDPSAGASTDPKAAAGKATPAPLPTSPIDAATIHLAKHTMFSVRLTKGRRDGSAKDRTKKARNGSVNVTTRVECRLGDRCKAHAAAQAIFALNDAAGVGADDIYQAAKAIAKLRREIATATKRYIHAYKKYAPAVKARHEKHEKLGDVPIEHDTLCLRPARVLEGLLHLQAQIAGTDEVMLAYLPREYRRPNSRKGHLFLLDVVTGPLLPAFDDKEIAALIPDGLGKNAVQRVSNRRLKLTGSRMKQDAFTAPVRIKPTRQRPALRGGRGGNEGATGVANPPDCQGDHDEPDDAA
jgi:hypothetical protein